jgi:hypothetical protein
MSDANVVLRIQGARVAPPSPAHPCRGGSKNGLRHE